MEGVYAVGRKERRRTKAGAPYLALELVDASGRIEARVWDDVELLDGRFAEGDAVRVLGRVERFGGRLQVQVRAVEVAEESDPADLTPTMRRDADELDGFLDFLAAEIAHPGLAALVVGHPRRRGRASVVSGASRRPARTVTTATPEGSSSTRSASRRCAARRRSCTRACGATSSSPRRCSTMWQHDRARPRPFLPPDRGGPPARPRSSRAAADRGAGGEPRHGRPGGAVARRRRAPRPAGGAHRRGRRALPREPARRPGRDPPRRRGRRAR